MIPGSLMALWQAASRGKNKSGGVLDYFAPEDIKAITAAVHAAEEHTSGEIRVKIRMRFAAGVSDIHEQAERDFIEAGVHNTKEKTGVLILVVLEARTFKILADTGIHSKLPQEYWANHAAALTRHFAGGNYAHGISAVVADVGSQLSHFFPKRNDDVNELPDDVILEGF